MAKKHKSEDPVSVLDKDTTATVGIVLPTQVTNRVQWLQAQVKSIIDQTYPNWKLVIVDDGSGKQGTLVLKKLPQDDRITVLRSEVHLGLPLALNLGFSKLLDACEYFSWVADDNLCFPIFLERIVTLLHGTNNDFYMGSCQVIDGGMDQQRIASPFSSEALETGGWHTIAWGWKQAVFTKIGGFDPYTFGIEDLNFMLRARDAGFKFINDEQIVAGWRLHPAQMSGAMWRSYSIHNGLLHAKKRAQQNPFIPFDTETQEIELPQLTITLGASQYTLDTSFAYLEKVFPFIQQSHRKTLVPVDFETNESAEYLKVAIMVSQATAADVLLKEGSSALWQYNQEERSAFIHIVQVLYNKYPNLVKSLLTQETREAALGPYS